MADPTQKVDIAQRSRNQGFAAVRDVHALDALVDDLLAVGMLGEATATAS